MNNKFGYCLNIIEKSHNKSLSLSEDDIMQDFVKLKIIKEKDLNKKVTKDNIHYMKCIVNKKIKICKSINKVSIARGTMYPYYYILEE